MKKFIIILVLIVLYINTLFAEKNLNIDVEVDGAQYTSDSVQMLKLKYEREALQYNDAHIVIGSLDGIVGVGKVNLVPEFYTLTFELKTSASKFGSKNNKEAKLKATEENTKSMWEFTDFLISIGVKPENITTTQYYVEVKSKALGNVADVVHRLKVKFDITARIGEVYKKIEPTDIEVASEIEYDVSEKTKKDARLLAYKYAIKDAIVQAENIGENGNFEIGDIKSVSEKDARGNYGIRIKREKFDFSDDYSDEDGREPSVIRQVERVVYRDIGNVAAAEEVPEYVSVPISINQEIYIDISLDCSFDMIKKIK
ncbi:MAG: SIMPL domain-containing protein [Fusobacteriaceae bacterium]|jgi:uncharacterized protein YggE|nr:SIMPL domain-containing protein [Fusobacteriaceae bacterium]